MLDESKVSQERIANELAKKQRIIRVAMGEEPADLVLKNADYVNVFSGEMAHGDIAVANGLVVGIGSYSGKTEHDMTGKIVIPGFVDAHIHLESALVRPSEFARAVLPHGTTCVICDPHEISNVCGVRGIDYMLQATQGLPLDVFFMLPSCVPAAPVDESGAELTWWDINPYFDHPRVLGLAEMMNYPGVTSGERATLEKMIVAQMHHRMVDGHAPGLSGNALNAYISAGIYSDHECATMEDALEKLRKGQFIMIRNGTAAQNLKALVGLLKPPYASRCMFCTDDKHPYDLLHYGHIDDIARQAVHLGANPLVVVQAATHHAAQYFGFHNRGAIAPGYLADFAVVDNLTGFHVCMTFQHGRLTYDGKQAFVEDPPINKSVLHTVCDTFHLPPVTQEQLAANTYLPLIGMIEGQIITNNLGHADGIDIQNDILKMAVAERHCGTGHLGVCYVNGYGLRSGAVATSIAHDSHNIIGVGASDADLALAMNAIAEMKGGVVVVQSGHITAKLPLPIAGLISDQPLAQVNEQLEYAKAQAFSQGVNPGIDPFMTLSFMSLPVIPSLRLLTRGAFSVEDWAFID